MGRDNHPKTRQLKREMAKEKSRAPYDRILIVTEGKKTEPNYLREIISTHRLNFANIVLYWGQLGTAPLQVVEYAEQLFTTGDLHKGIKSRSFDQVLVVFDRDDHPSYQNALSKVKALNNTLRNDDNKLVAFKAFPSNPSFELWLLLHFEDVQGPIHRNEVMSHLCSKNNMPNYAKGASGVYKETEGKLEIATKRAKKLAERCEANPDANPYTAMHHLVELLTKLRRTEF